LAVCASTTVSVSISRTHHIVKATVTVKGEAHVDERVVKEVAHTLVWIVAAISTPRVGEKWIGHGMAKLAKN
jgi:hypothetical protein